MAATCLCGVCNKQSPLEHMQDIWNGSRYIAACPDCVTKFQNTPTPPTYARPDT